MRNQNILYVCVNDGSDTRVIKEISTLSKEYKVFYLGIGTKSESSFSLEMTEQHILISGSHKSIGTILKLVWQLILLLYKFNFKKVHVVDEQLYCFIFPLLIGKRVTLDIFDSYFLKLNLPGNKFYLLKRIIYGLPRKIIVTDENRYSLLPKFAQEKAVVIPNVPRFAKYFKKRNTNDYLTICYFGSLNKDRGTYFLEKLLHYDDNIKVIAAGWLTDDYTKLFVNHPRVTFLGIKKQSDVNAILAEKGDYLLSVYPVNNTNNIYASPNKIYDAIQTQTPIIINSEIFVASFVKNINIGYVIKNSLNIDFEKLIFELKEKRNSYSFNDKLVEEYSWEKYETKLLNL
ncbi:hypothetical protein ACMDB5_01700 [Flavobacterium sp. W1B]|uniref:hypothetical protein n=1 Tax=Flavobacterium sp. W1B TaxID=3394146 RepID=UPI0039BC5A79